MLWWSIAAAGSARGVSACCRRGSRRVSIVSSGVLNGKGGSGLFCCDAMLVLWLNGDMRDCCETLASFDIDGLDVVEESIPNCPSWASIGVNGLKSMTEACLGRRTPTALSSGMVSDWRFLMACSECGSWRVPGR